MYDSGVAINEINRLFGRVTVIVGSQNVAPVVKVEINRITVYHVGSIGGDA